MIDHPPPPAPEDRIYETEYLTTTAQLRALADDLDRGNRLMVQLRDMLRADLSLTGPPPALASQLEEVHASIYARGTAILEAVPEVMARAEIILGKLGCTIDVVVHTTRSPDRKDATP